jgi:L-asparaginase
VIRRQQIDNRDMKFPLALLSLGLILGQGPAVLHGRQAPAPARGDVNPNAVARLPKVLLIATGGTISNRTGGRLTGDDLLKSMPGLDRYVRAEAEQFANVASSELSIPQWLDLARRINAAFDDDQELAGIVVTSGTDTLEETAYFLNLTVRSEKPVVVVGSMRNPSTLGYEGAANLLEGFRVAAEPASRGKGVLVVLNDEINAARDVTKTDALRLDTFQSRDYGILGVVDSDRVVFYRAGVKRHTAAAEFDIRELKDLPRVDVIMVYQGASGDLIKAAVDQGAKGIVIASAGAGATSGTQGEGIQYAVSKGVFVVTSTRTGSGRIAAGRRGRAGGGDARVEPILRIAAEDLAPVKARILLMLAIAAKADGAAIQRMFTEY